MDQAKIQGGVAMAEFAAYIPIGPSHLDAMRAKDLVHSIYKYEPGIRSIALLDHGPTPRSFRDIANGCPMIPIHTIKFCSQQDNGTWLGAGCATNLVAIEYLYSRFDLDFVVKLDTDALVIAPFSEKLLARFRRLPDIGISGTLGNSCDRQTRTYKFNVESKQRFQLAVETGKKLRRSSYESLDNLDIVRWNLFSEDQCNDFLSICDEILPAFLNGFEGEHCQGGAYAISKRFVCKMREAGYLRRPLRWLYIPINEDRMMGIYCRALGMNLDDYSEATQVFGVQSIGLPYDPAQMLAKQFSIIHSVRDSRQHSERSVRRFFAERRDMSLMDDRI